MFKIKMKLLITTLFVSAVLFAGQALVFSSASVSATPIPVGCPGSTLSGPPAQGVCESIPPGCPGSTLSGPPAQGVACPYEAAAQGASTATDKCKGTTTDIQNCIYTPSTDNKDIKNFYGQSCSTQQQQDSACGIFGYINLAIKLLSALIGIVATGMIIVAGIMYSAAGSDPGKVEKAKKLMGKAIMTLVGFGLLFAISQWLLPGGILNLK